MKLIDKRLDLVLSDLKIGDIFSVSSHDAEDNIDLTFKYIYSKKGYIFLGGSLEDEKLIGDIHDKYYINDNFIACLSPTASKIRFSTKLF